MYKYIIISIFGLIIINSCSDSTSTSEELNLSDYANRYSILFVKNTSLFSIGSDGRELKLIKEFEQLVQDFTLTADYSKIAFAYALDGIPEIYMMDFDGSNLRKITQDPSAEAKLVPRFIESENSIIYNCDGRIFRIDYDGSNTRAITPDSLIISSHYSTSIHNDKIVFTGFRIDGQTAVSRIYKINTDGTGLTSLTNSGVYNNPQFSPDGEKVIYKSFQDDNGEIFLMNQDGTNKQNISNTPDNEHYAGWAPDGSMIYFESYRDDGYTSLSVVNPDGSGLREVYRRKLWFQFFYPAWSPDLTRMVFAIKTGDADYRDTIFILDMESGLTKKLTDGRSNLIWLNN